MSNAVFGNQNFRPIHVRDNFLFLKGNVKGFATQGSEEGTSEVVAGNSNPGSFPDVPCVIGIYHCFGEAAQPGNIRSIDVEQLFNYSAITNLPSGQSIAAIRGAVSHAEGTAFGSGLVNEYSYGVQGKQLIQSTINVAAGFVAALFGQLDTSNASAVVTSGYISALHLDMGATSVLSSGSEAFVNAETITNTCATLKMNSVIKVIANASYLFDLAESNLTGNWIVGTTGSTAAGTLKVLVNGAVRYIQLFSAVA